MHLLVITTHNIISPRFGGELRVSRLLESLLESGGRLSIIRYKHHGDTSLPKNNDFFYHEINLPLGYPMAPLALMTHVFDTQSRRIALEINENHPIDIVQSDPPWAALSGLRIARTLGVPHIILSQNCETALSTHISEHGPARKIPIIGNVIARINLLILQEVEKHVISQSKLTLTPSKFDVIDMRRYGIPTQNVKLLPNGTGVRMLPHSKRLGIRKKLGVSAAMPVGVFLGRLDYPPNREAVYYIRREIAPHCQDVIFLIAGMNPPDIDSLDNMIILGYVDDIDELLCACDFAVVPIFYGSGTRIKILDAWAAGLPVITTSAAISGLDYEPNGNAIIEDDIKQFKTRILDLVHSPVKPIKLRNAALKASSQYKWETIGEQYVQILKEISKGK